MAMAQMISDSIKPQFAAMGLALDTFIIDTLSLPEELQAMLDKRIGVNMMGGMQAYTQFQTAEAISAHLGGADVKPALHELAAHYAAEAQVRGEIVLFGGFGGTDGRLFNDTWTWSGSP